MLPKGEGLQRGPSRSKSCHQEINYNWKVGLGVSVLSGEVAFKSCLEMSQVSLRGGRRTPEEPVWALPGLAGSMGTILRPERPVPLLAHLRDVLQTMTHSHLCTAVPWRSMF